MSTCNPNTLLASGACYQCLSEEQFQMAVLQLLCDISSAGGGGGGGSQEVFQGNTPPVAAPTDPTKPALYTDLNSGILWTWNVTTVAWV